MLHQVYEWHKPHKFTPTYYFEVFKGDGREGKDAILLESDSSSKAVSGNRYSYIALDASVNDKLNPHSFSGLEKSINEARSIFAVSEDVVPPGTPPFSHGGAIGYIGYDVKNEFVQSREGLLKTTAKDDQGFPNLYMLFPKTILCFDAKERKVYVTTFCDDGARLSDVKKVLEEKVLRPIEEIKKREKGLSVSKDEIVALSNMTQEEYFEMVAHAKEHILSGNSYQLKVSQRLKIALIDTSWNVYKRLRSINPSPFSAYLALDEIDLVSCSPEELLRVTNLPNGANKIVTRPIGGTYPRGDDATTDNELIQQFLADTKERAEHAMLVDLLRNDVGSVSSIGRKRAKKEGWKSLGSVEWSERPYIETYSALHHFVTTVQGELRSDLNSFDAFRSLFPGGTITGCPKIRSMQIIDELEPTSRGPYTGSIGYITFRDEAQWNIIIRTLLHNTKTHDAFIQVGGGIVHDSDPMREWHETLWKAEALLRAV